MTDILWWLTLIVFGVVYYGLLYETDTWSFDLFWGQKLYLLVLCFFGAIAADVAIVIIFKVAGRS